MVRVYGRFLAPFSWFDNGAAYYILGAGPPCVNLISLVGLRSGLLSGAMPAIFFGLLVSVAGEQCSFVKLLGGLILSHW